MCFCHTCYCCCRERPQFIPTDYKKLARGLTNSRHGEVTYHREWSASGPRSSKRAGAKKEQRIQDPGLDKFAAATFAMGSCPAPCETLLIVKAWA